MVVDKVAVTGTDAKGLTRGLLIEENDAASSYASAAAQTADIKAKKLYGDIGREEKVHAGELNALLDEQDPENEEAMEEGEEEAKGLLSNGAYPTGPRLAKPMTNDIDRPYAEVAKAFRRRERLGAVGEKLRDSPGRDERIRAEDRAGKKEDMKRKGLHGPARNNEKVLLPGDHHAQPINWVPPEKQDILNRVENNKRKQQGIGTRFNDTDETANKAFDNNPAAKQYLAQMKTREESVPAAQNDAASEPKTEKGQPIAKAKGDTAVPHKMVNMGLKQSSKNKNKLGTENAGADPWQVSAAIRNMLDFDYNVLPGDKGNEQVNQYDRYGAHYSGPESANSQLGATYNGAIFLPVYAKDRDGHKIEHKATRTVENPAFDKNRDDNTVPRYITVPRTDYVAVGYKTDKNGHARTVYQEQKYEVKRWKPFRLGRRAKDKVVAAWYEKMHKDGLIDLVYKDGWPIPVDIKKPKTAEEQDLNNFLQNRSEARAAVLLRGARAAGEALMKTGEYPGLVRSPDTLYGFRDEAKYVRQPVLDKMLQDAAMPAVMAFDETIPQSKEMFKEWQDAGRPQASAEGGKGAWDDFQEEHQKRTAADREKNRHVSQENAMIGGVPASEYYAKWKEVSPDEAKTILNEMPADEFRNAMVDLHDYASDITYARIFGPDAAAEQEKAEARKQVAAMKKQIRAAEVHQREAEQTATADRRDDLIDLGSSEAMSRNRADQNADEDYRFLQDLAGKFKAEGDHPWSRFSPKQQEYITSRLDEIFGKYLPESDDEKPEKATTMDIFKQNQDRKRHGLVTADYLAGKGHYSTASKLVNGEYVPLNEGEMVAGKDGAEYGLYGRHKDIKGYLENGGGERDLLGGIHAALSAISRSKEAPNDRALLGEGGLNAQKQQREHAEDVRITGNKTGEFIPKENSAEMSRTKRLKEREKLKQSSESAAELGTDGTAGTLAGKEEDTASEPATQSKAEKPKTVEPTAEQPSASEYEKPKSSEKIKQTEARSQLPTEVKNMADNKTKIEEPQGPAGAPPAGPVPAPEKQAPAVNESVGKKKRGLPGTAKKTANKDKPIESSAATEQPATPAEADKGPKDKDGYEQTAPAKKSSSFREIMKTKLEEIARERGVQSEGGHPMRGGVPIQNGYRQVFMGAGRDALASPMQPKEAPVSHEGISVKTVPNNGQIKKTEAKSSRELFRRVFGH